MKKKRYTLMNIILLILIVGLGIPIDSAKADMGPKPTADFDFIFETSNDLEIIEAALMQCETIKCLHPQKLEELGPQGFSCELERCTSMAYGYMDFLYLEITFSDGETRFSNVFEKEYFNSLYQVTVFQEDLMVEETGGQLNEMTKILLVSFIGVCLFSCILISGLVILIVFIVKIIKKK